MSIVFYFFRFPFPYSSGLKVCNLYSQGPLPAGFWLELAGCWKAGSVEKRFLWLPVSDSVSGNDDGIYHSDSVAKFHPWVGHSSSADPEIQS